MQQLRCRELSFPRPYNFEVEPAFKSVSKSYKSKSYCAMNSHVLSTGGWGWGGSGGMLEAIMHQFSSVQFSSVAQSCLTLCDPVNRSTPGLPVHHQLPEFTHTHVHRVGDAIQPSHPLSSPSPPAPNPSQHQGLFQWVNSSHEVAKVLEFQLQCQSFQWTWTYGTWACVHLRICRGPETSFSRY